MGTSLAAPCGTAKSTRLTSNQLAHLSGRSLSFCLISGVNRLVGFAFRRFAVIGAPKQEGLELHIGRLRAKLGAGQQNQCR